MEKRANFEKIFFRDIENSKTPFCREFDAESNAPGGAPAGLIFALKNGDIGF